MGRGAPTHGQWRHTADSTKSLGINLGDQWLELTCIRPILSVPNLRLHGSHECEVGQEHAIQKNLVALCCKKTRVFDLSLIGPMKNLRPSRFRMWPSSAFCMARCVGYPPSIRVSFTAATGAVPMPLLDPLTSFQAPPWYGVDDNRLPAVVHRLRLCYVIFPPRPLMKMTAYAKFSRLVQMQ